MRKTIAIADDHNLLRFALCELLTTLGYKVVTNAANGKDLIHRLAFTDPLPDICIINMKMPVTDGIETIRQIKGRWPQIRILSYSFYKTKEQIDHILASGADAFLLKGGDARELKRILDEL